MRLNEGCLKIISIHPSPHPHPKSPSNYQVRTDGYGPSKLCKHPKSNLPDADSLLWPPPPQVVQQLCQVSLPSLVLSSAIKFYNVISFLVPPNHTNSHYPSRSHQCASYHNNPSHTSHCHQQVGWCVWTARNLNRNKKERRQIIFGKVK